jgi:transcriptional regulator with XRE-family HTH domain
MRQKVSTKRVIKFTNMQPRRVGSGIREIRLRRGLSLEEFACVTDLLPDYLDRLEEGYEPEVERAVLERILEKGRVRCRYYTDEDIINVFLCISPRNPLEKLA